MCWTTLNCYFNYPLIIPKLWFLIPKDQVMFSGRKPYYFVVMGSTWFYHYSDPKIYIKFRRNNYFVNNLYNETRLLYIYIHTMYISFHCVKFCASRYIVIVGESTYIYIYTESIYKLNRTEKIDIPNLNRSPEREDQRAGTAKFPQSLCIAVRNKATRYVLSISQQ